MPWRIVERRIGRAGGLKQRTARQREWDEKHDRDNWMIGYALDGEFVSQENAPREILAIEEVHRRLGGVNPRG